MNKAIKLDNRDIPQIQYDKNMKILTEIQKFAYFDFKTKPPSMKTDTILNKENTFAQMTHTNLHTHNIPELKEKNNEEYKEYLKSHKHSVNASRSHN